MVSPQGVSIAATAIVCIEQKTQKKKIFSFFKEQLVVFLFCVQQASQKTCSSGD